MQSHMHTRAHRFVRGVSSVRILAQSRALSCCFAFALAYERATKVASLVMLGSVTIVVIDVRQYGQREAPPPRRMICAAHASQHCEWPQGWKRVVRGASMQMTHM